MTRDFLGYIERISEGATRAQIAKIAGVSGSTITRWDPSRSDHIKPKADAVIAIAQHYGQPPLEALIEAGVLTASDARIRVAARSLSEYSHAALLRELQHRLDGMSAPPEKISGPEDYGEEPIPDDYELAAGTVAREDDHLAD
ncbi:helix-turn-helix domain-containing protein [Brachybacterium alimentarium]|uniref:helix-turn-helix domain-containing protein n=1 Tax=Brachybacterium alimentarium TaxID=47845 RepID=UPI003FD1BB2C